MTKKVGLRLERAVGRIRNDTWDDLWPDVADLIDLPVSAVEFGSVRKLVNKLRGGGAVRPALVEVVPKPDGLTRPGHYLWPLERIYLQALVDTVLHAIDSRLGGRGNIFGYRALNGRSSTSPFGKPLDQWFAFRQHLKDAARYGGYEALVETDVASYFERIQHQRLETQLVSLGVPAEVAGEIRSLLRHLVGSTMGLPQGSDPSSVLASAYLEPVDAYMLRKGYAFFRYVDDVYIFSNSEAEARVALRDLEAQLRDRQLQLQSGKTTITVGGAKVRKAVEEKDAEVGSIAWVYRRAPRPKALQRLETKWRSISRRKPFPARIGRYVLRRLTAANSDLALNWCLRNLGVLDWLTREVGPYLSLFATRPTLQIAINHHLRSPRNNSAAEESSLFRVLLSASRVDRVLLDYTRTVVANRNASPFARQWAVVLLGRHGDAADHSLIVAHAKDSEALARASVIAAQGMATATRGLVLSEVSKAFPHEAVLARRVRGLATAHWPTYVA